MKFGLLSTFNHPLLPYFITNVIEQGTVDLVVICDSKEFTKKNRAVWRERTGGKLPDHSGGSTRFKNLESYEIPFFFVDNHNNQSTIELIQRTGVKCLLNAGTPRKLSRTLLNSAEYGAINVHPGVLPRYRGSSAVEWAIYNDEQIGNTAHFVTEGYDEGPIIETERYYSSKEADYNSIRTQVYMDGCKLAGKVVKQVNDHQLKPSDCAAQNEKDAVFRTPIPSEAMVTVLQKIKNKEYRYMTK